MEPVGALDLPPPRCLGDRLRGGKVVGEQAGEDEGPPEPLGFRQIARFVDERAELCVRHGAGVDEEGADLHLAKRSLTVLRVGEPIL